MADGQPTTGGAFTRWFSGSLHGAHAWARNVDDALSRCLGGCWLECCWLGCWIGTVRLSRSLLGSVEHIFPWVPVQRLLQPLLVQRMSDQANGAGKHEEAVEVSNVDDALDVIRREMPARGEKIEEEGADAAVNVQNQVGALLQSVLLHSDRKVQVGCARKVLTGVLLKQLYALVAVVLVLDAVADAGDAQPLLLHALHKVVRGQALGNCLPEVASSVINSASKAGADGQEAAAQGGHNVLACPGRHDGVVSARHARAVISAHHDAQLDELGGVFRKLALEPQQRDHVADGAVLFNELAHAHGAVVRLFAAVI
mmetsp:Transcript_10085/g.25813  ORF Transcript_10085/g.25813 Transcript_10085/m.25813 type:complete len:313 (+) Transcript_10085:195-1133(+)